MQPCKLSTSASSKIRPDRRSHLPHQLCSLLGSFLKLSACAGLCQCAGCMGAASTVILHASAQSLRTLTKSSMHSYTGCQHCHQHHVHETKIPETVIALQNGCVCTCRSFGCSAPVGTVYSINPAMIMTLVPLVGAAATHYSHFDMIHYGSYVSALAPLWMALFTTGDHSTEACVYKHKRCRICRLLHAALTRLLLQ